MNTTGTRNPRPAAPYVGRRATVPQLFAEQARSSPDAVAVDDCGVATTYRELDASANRLADLLMDRGIGAGSVVAVSLRRGCGLVTAVLAVLKSGAAYLVLDPALPARRRESLATTGNARLVIGDDPGLGLEALDPAAAELDVRSAGPSWPPGPSRTCHADDLAYLMFTSGSTGQPKPVAITHGGLASHAVAVADAFGLSDADRVLQFANPAFDVFGEEIYPTLLAGATITVLPDPVPTPAELEEHLRRQHVTVANLPTPYWAQWVDDLDRQPRGVPETLRLLVVGSDAGHTRTLAGWRRHSGCPVLNAYGLTETTITATVQEFVGAALPAGDALPVGRPLAGTQAYVLDDDLAPVPPGTVGELYLGGAQLAQGYLGLPALTAERFVPDPFGGTPGARLYRTGDAASLDHDGALVLHGRIDDQVKIRGQRVEPGEVSAALCRHPAVRQAHVGAVEDPAGDRRLVGYVVAAEDVSPPQLRAHLLDLLPGALVPDAFVLLDRLPLTANGKVDRAALDRAALDRAALDRAALDRAALDRPPAQPARERAPLAGLELQIADIWREVLRIEDVHPDDAFFDLGGHSLLLVQVQRRLTAALGRQVPSVALFTHPTVRQLAAHLSGADPGGPTPERHRADTLRSGRARMQQRLARQRVDGRGR